MSTYLPSLFTENLMDMFDGLDRDMGRGLRWADQMFGGKPAPRVMKTDVRETDSAYEMEMELPGFHKEDITLELHNGNLTVSAKRNEEKKDTDKNGRILRQERYSGSMSRSFYVGSHVTEEDVKARFEDGVLKLSVPKKEARKAEEKKTILIEG